MIPTLLDDELWSAADPGVPMAPVILVDEDPEVEEVVLSGSSALG